MTIFPEDKPSPLLYKVDSNPNHKQVGTCRGLNSIAENGIDDILIMELMILMIFF